MLDALSRAQRDLSGIPLNAEDLPGSVRAMIQALQRSKSNFAKSEEDPDGYGGGTYVEILNELNELLRRLGGENESKPVSTAPKDSVQRASE